MITEPTPDVTPREKLRRLLATRKGKVKVFKSRREREVFTLYLEGKEPSEIAEQLSLPRVKVRKMVGRVAKFLRGRPKSQATAQPERTGRVWRVSASV